MPAPHYYTAQATRELDRIAIEEFGIPGFTLMQRAASAALKALLDRWPDTRVILVFSGTGNNGGDGLLLAAQARQAGIQATVTLIGAVDKLQGAALQAYRFAEAQAVPIHQQDSSSLVQGNDPHTVVVDALLGTGLQGTVRAPFVDVIKAINGSGLPVLAIDIPSGLCSDTGAVLGTCIRADLTVTYIGRKIGLVSGAGPDYCGELVFDDLGVPTQVYEQVKPIN